MVTVIIITEVVVEVIIVGAAADGVRIFDLSNNTLGDKEFMVIMHFACLINMLSFMQFFLKVVAKNSTVCNDNCKFCLSNCVKYKLREKLLNFPS